MSLHSPHPLEAALPHPPGAATADPEGGPSPPGKGSEYYIYIYTVHIYIVYIYTYSRARQRIRVVRGAARGSRRLSGRARQPAVFARRRRDRPLGWRAVISWPVSPWFHLIHDAFPCFCHGFRLFANLYPLMPWPERSQ